MKTAFLFSGQGAQYSGMGAALYSAFPEARDIYDSVSQALGRDIAKLSFEGSAEELACTENSQSAIFALSMAGYAILKQRGITPDAVAGFSLGECSALHASGMLGLSDAVDMIVKRGELMQRSAGQKQGAMCAVLGLSDEAVERVCSQIEGYVVPVNYNCPGQVVIAGDADAVSAAAEAMKTAGAMKTVPLKVAGAFHTAHMSEAAASFKDYLAGLPFVSPAVPLYSNVTGGLLEVSSPKEYMPEYLAKHMTSPVLFSRQAQSMLDDGITAFVELGPGRTLSGFMRKISREATVVNVEDIASLEKALEQLAL
ncbi:MAG: ACP S-malonyltransferase [Eubacteriales bacterium]